MENPRKLHWMAASFFAAPGEASTCKVRSSLMQLVKVSACMQLRPHKMKDCVGVYCVALHSLGNVKLGNLVCSLY